MEVFVFPLGHAVLYPSIARPLNIFEPRYLQMVRDSIADGIPIALANVDEPDREYSFHTGAPLSFVRSIAGYGHPLILDERKDGTLLIYLQGKGKVQLGNVIDRQKPFIVCEAQDIVENHELKNQIMPDFLKINKVLLNWLETHISEPGDREQFIRNIQSVEQVIGCFASYLVADHDMQQLLLESNDINEKVQIVQGLINSGEIV